MRVNKIGFAILSVLLFSVSINAAEITYVNAFPIYTYGDVDYLAAIFEFIKGIMSDDAVQTVFGMGFSISAFIAGVKTSKIGGLSEIVRSAAFPMSLYVFFAVPTVNVHIVDQRVDRGLINYVTPDGGYKKVEDVPYAMAFIPSSASLLVSAFIDLVDNNWFGVAEGNQFSTLGFQKTSEISKEALIIAKLKDINVASSGAVYDMNQYIKVCLIDQGLKSPANTHILTHATKPFPDMFDPANYVGNLSSQRVSFTDSNGTDVVDATCEDVYDTYVLSKASTIETEMGELLQKRFPTVDLNSATFNEGWREQIGDNIATVGTIQKMMATTAATRALERALDTEGIGVNGVSMATQLSIDATLTNLQTEGLAKWEWITRVLPDGLSIVLGILLGAMPLMVLVMSFMGSNAIKGAVFFTSGYVAINFNLVSMALVNNIIGIYTSKHAAEAMSAYAGMPFGLSQINDFMLKQADMAGLAGIIAGVSVFAVTPLIFKGETAGFGAAMSAVSGAFRGNVSQTAQKTLTDYDAQRTLDEQALTYNGMNEAEAAQWLHSEGFSIPNSMSAVQAYQDIMKNMTAIGAGSAAEILHHGNPNFNADNYIEGTKAQAISKAAQTAGYGQAVNNGVVSEAEIENVSIQDGNVMGAKTHAVAQDRDKAGFDAELVGYGQGHSQVAKEMGMQEIGADSDALEKLTASSRLQAKEQLASGEAAMNMFQGYNGFGALDVAGNDHIKNVMTKAAAKLMQSAGEGSTIDTDKALAKAYEDGARTGSATNKASDHMFSGTTDKDGRTLYDRDLAAEGQAMDEMARHQQNMQTATAASKFKTGEEDGYADFITGKGASARKDANDAIGVGEKFGAMNDKEQIDLMRQVKENAARGFEGGIKAANAELHAGVDKDGKRYDRSVEQAIADDVTGAQEKGISSSAHASNLKEKFGNDLKSITTVPEASEEAKAQLFDAMLNEQNPLKKAAMAKQLDAMINN
ncbi:MAG: conjugal transfer protein TraG N-terminal domain-containing protein, partial [Epsilonproteobacteria bacterium]|nr:conjugal transfer protein TraG N-terminal domain-containing protein [Campylobacterota bacterium]